MPHLRLASLLLLLLLAVPAPRASAGGEAPRWHSIIAAANVTGLAIDARGSPSAAKWGYAVDYLNHTVIKFGTGGRRLRTWKYAAPTRYKTGADIAVGGSGNVFVADADHSAILKFDPSGRLLARWDAGQAADGGFNQPIALALDRAGNIYVAEDRAQRITKLSPAGKILARWNTVWIAHGGASTPETIAVGPDGTMYVAVHCSGNACPPPHGVQVGILELSPSGAFQRLLLGANPYDATTQPGTQPWVWVSGIATDHQGTLYAAVQLRGSLANTLLTYQAGRLLPTRISLPQQSPATAMAVAGNTIYVAANGHIWST